jgi:hypothetical protein
MMMMMITIIIKGYGLDDHGVGVRFPAWARYFSLLHNVQTGSAPLPPYNGYRKLFPRG